MSTNANTMTRREFVKAGVAAMAATAPLATMGRTVTGSGKKPNIVFLFADQLRACNLGCMGNPDCATPNLDRLAKDGLLVTNAISCAPVCSPFRAQLLTGRYPHTNTVIHNDIRLPDSEVVISEVMKKQGYATGYIGKWHLAQSRRDPVDKVNRRGWDFWAVRNCSHRHFKPVYWLNDSRASTAVDGWEPDIQTDLAVEFIKERKDGPLCLFVSYGPPHPPYGAPDRYEAMYRGKKLEKRPNGSNSSLMQSYAATTSLDDCLGRVVDALAEAGVADDTILCFSSDHGDMIGSQGSTNKQRPWEESINIPFVLRYPHGVKAGRKQDWLVSSVDMMPTLLGLAGIPIPQGVEGMDWSDTFRGVSDKEREAAFLFNVHHGKSPRGGGNWRGIRTKEWVYAHRADSDWVMYDLKNDPYELKNLVDDPAHAGKKRALRGQLDAIRKGLGEDVPMDSSAKPGRRKPKRKRSR